MQTIEKIYDNMGKVFNRLLRNCIIPNQKYKDVKEINIEEVKRWRKIYNIEGVILDIDGTLRKNMEDIDFSNIRWIMDLNKEFALKPLNRPFLEAAKVMNLSPKNIIVVGNEYLTDIFGGNRNNMMTVIIDEEMEI